MFRHTDGGRIGSRTSLGGRLQGRAVLGMVCLFALLPSGRALAQEAASPEATAPASPPPAGSFQAKIQRVEAASAERIELLNGRSILVDANRPLKHVAIGDEHVAAVNIVSSTQAMLSAKGVGSTSLVLWDANGQQVTYEIVVQLDLALLRAAIDETAPGSKVDVRPLGEKIILRGIVPDVDTAERIVQLAQIFMTSGSAAAASSSQGTGPAPGPASGSSGGAAVQQGAGLGGGRSTSVVNHLVVAGEHQVVLRCTVAEVSKSAVRALGINGWLAGDNVPDMFVVNQIAGINPVNIGAAKDQNVMLPLAFVTDKNGLPMTTTPELSLGFPRVQMQLFFKAMRENRLLRVLAEPNLMALSGQEASFLAGGQFASVTSGITGTTIEWKEFGIRLRFTPTVIGRQMIRLRVAPEVSDLDPTTGINTPEVKIPGGLITRRAETTIELASGSTIAIAGLLSERVRGVSQKVPGLGDVPVLGALFSSVSYQKDVTELVILVTPELAASLQPDQVDAVPGQSSVDPNDFQLFGLGMVEGDPAREESEPGEALKTATPPRYPKLSSPPEQMTLHGPWGPADAAEAKSAS